MMTSFLVTPGTIRIWVAKSGLNVTAVRRAQVLGKRLGFRDMGFSCYQDPLRDLEIFINDWYWAP